MDNEHEFDRGVKKKTCCFCGKRSKDQVKKFNYQTLVKSHQNLKIRQARAWKYSDISLPSLIDEDIGYHTQCYRAFNAVCRKFDPENPSTSANESEATLHSSNDPTIDDIEPPTSEIITEEDEGEPGLLDGQQNASGREDDSNELVEEEENAVDMQTGVDSMKDQVCIFCDLNRKRKSGRTFKLSSTTLLQSLQNVQKLATMTDDVDFLKKLETLTCENTTYYYHPICKSNYISAGQVKVKKEENEHNPWHLKRNSYSKAYEKVCLFVEENIIGERQFYYVSFLQRLLLQFLHEEYTTNGIDFPNKIVLLASSYLRTTAITDGKPEVILHYNKTKGGTDCFDQLCHTYTTARGTRRWPMRFFFGILDQAIVNARILHNCRCVNNNEENNTFSAKQCLKQVTLHLVELHLRKRGEVEDLRTDLKQGIAGILGSETALQQSGQRQYSQKRVRCGLCKRHEDHKTQQRCSSCSRPMCDTHRMFICIDCGEEQ